MAEKEIENVETESTENVDNIQQEKQVPVKRMVMFECKLPDGNMVRGIPNIVAQDDTMIASHEDWTKSGTEIKMDDNAPDYMGKIAKAYGTDNELSGVLLIKRISNTQYWIMPVGVPDFILLCVETAKKMQLHVVE